MSISKIEINAADMNQDNTAYWGLKNHMNQVKCKNRLMKTIENQNVKSC